MNKTQRLNITIYEQSILSALSGYDVVAAWLVAVVVIVGFALLS